MTPKILSEGTPIGEMTSLTPEANLIRSRGLARMRDFFMLTKPVIVLLLLFTTYAGMVVGGGTIPSASVTWWTMLGGYLAAGGASAINQYIDRSIDGRMQRTARRPIPAGKVTPKEALVFGLVLCVLALVILSVFVNLLAAALSLVGMIYYVVVYSLLLKYATVQNIVVGGGAGAIPPLVGWAAATGSLEWQAALLFLLVFLWTPAHFWALAIVRRSDYARAGVPMLPVIRGETETRKQVFFYTVALVALSLLLPVFGLGGALYLGLAVMLGLWLLAAAWRVYRHSGNKISWKMYRYSSMYLAFIFLALMIDVVL